MTWPILLSLYAVVTTYAALTYFLGELVPLATIVLGFGIFIILYLMLEWVATPMVAAFMGFHARWSVGTALVFGLPLVVAFTFVTPVVSSGNATLAVPVPWLSVYTKSRVEVLPLIWERLVWWGVLYAVSMLLGLVSRKLKPVDVTQK